MKYIYIILLFLFKRRFILPSSKACIAFLLLPVGLQAQIVVTTPLERSVYQRDSDGSAYVTISGSYTTAIDKVEARMIPVNSGQGQDISWTTIQTNPTSGLYSGSIHIPGGWYKIEVRGTRNGIVVGNSAAVQKMGVGEVFVIAGQSNAQGINYTSPAASDDRVNYINYDNEISNSLNDPPAPAFTQLGSSTHTMGLRGHGTWCWGILGDLLASKLNVPILFVNVAWEGTGLLNWTRSSRNEPTWDVFSGLVMFPSQMPYGNLRLSMQHYVKQYGVRAVLWMQGESDNFPLNTSFDNYKNGLKGLINKLSSDVNFRIPWVISRTSRIMNGSNVSTTSSNVILAQNAVIQELPGVAYAGPETDNLYPSRGGDGTHFQGVEGTTILANAWNDIMDDAFFTLVSPVSVTNEPKITSVCATDNSSVNLTLPDGYLNYSWYREENGALRNLSGGRSITVREPGVYTAKVKDAFGNTLRTQKMSITTSIKPATPTILQSGSQQACADSSFTYSINAGIDEYTWYKDNVQNSLINGNSLTVSESGTYFVKSQNVLGCLSDNSVASAFIVRPQVPTPVIAKTGPFTATANIDGTGFNESYDWKRGDTILTTSTVDSVRTTVTGLYSARAKAAFTLGNNVLTCYSLFSNELQVFTEGETDIIVFPNPGARDNVYVESRDDIPNAEIIVYDLFGRVRVTQKQDMKSRVKILVRNLPTGQYIVRIKGAGVDVSKQLVVL